MQSQSSRQRVGGEGRGNQHLLASVSLITFTSPRPLALTAFGITLR